jgi:hypothetical protein
LISSLQKMKFSSSPPKTRQSASPCPSPNSTKLKLTHTRSSPAAGNRSFRNQENVLALCPEVCEAVEHDGGSVPPELAPRVPLNAGKASRHTPVEELI